MPHPATKPPGTSARDSRFLHVLLLVPVVGLLLLGSRPAAGAKAVSLPSDQNPGTPLEIRWEPPNRPRALLWTESSSHPTVHVPKSNERSTTIQRNHSGDSAQILLAVAKNPRFSPVLRPVEPDQTSVTLTWSRIPDTTVWFWGITPSDPCPRSAKDPPLVFPIQFLGGEDGTHELRGGFAFRLTKPDEKGQLVFTVGKKAFLQSLESNGLRRVHRQTAKIKCILSGGVNCQRLFEPAPDSWGQHHEIRITADRPPNCPT